MEYDSDNGFVTVETDTRKIKRGERVIKLIKGIGIAIATCVGLSAVKDLNQKKKDDESDTKV